MSNPSISKPLGMVSGKRGVASSPPGSHHLGSPNSLSKDFSVVDKSHDPIDHTVSADAPLIAMETMTRTKTYVLDTNVLFHHAEALFAFKENDVVIPIAVIEEIDSQRKRQDDVGRNARMVSQILVQLRNRGSPGIIKTPCGR